MYEELSDFELISYCADNSNNQKALEAFFRRFNKYIDKRIKTVLRLAEIYDEDSHSDVKCEFIKKIKDGLLLRAVKNENPKAWIGRAVTNLAIERRRENNRLRDAYKNLGEKDALSLSEPAGDEDRRVREDFIINPDDDEQIEEIKEQTGILFESIEKLGENYRLTLKTAIMLYKPLTHEVITEIANKRERSYEAIAQEVSRIRKTLIERHNKNLTLQHKAANLWARINKLKQQRFIILQNKDSHHKKILELQNSINKLQNNPVGKNLKIIELYKKQITAMQANLEKIEALKKEIKKKEENRENNLKRRRSFIRPTSKQISDLLAISEDNAIYINTLLKRAREILQENQQLKKW